MLASVSQRSQDTPAMAPAARATRLVTSLTASPP